MSELERLIDVVRKLRDPVGGCPWDSVQTNMTLRRFWTEELGEYLDALEEGNYDAVRDELGDLLLQVVLNAQICADEGRFTIEDVAKSEADKMVRRHPHVFGESNATTEAEFRRQWETIKHSEKGYSKRTSVLDGVPRSMPALARAHKMLSKSRQAGFEWNQEADALAKVDEELAEVHAALASGNEAQIEEEIGDLLLAVTHLCRWHELQAEEVLQKAIAKYDGRFRKMEGILKEETGRDLASCSKEEMIDAWNKAKS